MLFCVRVPVWVLGYPSGPTPAPRPRRAQTWLHRAALGGVARQSPNRPIARRCRRRRERPGLPRVRRFRLRRIGRECTMPRTIAIPMPSRSCCCAAPTGPSRPTTGNAALRRTAETENRSSRARAGTRRSDGRKTMGRSRPTRRERERCIPPAASRPPPTLPASRPIPPRAACAVGACRRRSPNQRGGRQQPTQHTHGNGRPRCAPRRALLHPRV